MPISLTNQNVGNQLRSIANVPSFPAVLREEVNPSIVVNPANNPVFVDNVDSGIVTTTLTSTAVTGTGWYLMYTVPNGYIARIHTLRGRVSSGTFTINAIGIEESADTSGQVVIKELAAGAATCLFDGKTVHLTAGDKVYLYVDTHTVNGNLQLGLYGSLLQVR